MHTNLFLQYNYQWKEGYEFLWVIAFELPI